MSVTEDGFDQATRRGAELRARMPAAVRACYRSRHRCIEVTFANGMVLTVPVAIIDGLASAMPKALRVIKVKSGGRSLYWPDLDRSLSVSDLLYGVTVVEPRTT
jgi:hypothetical protein